jgi:phospholipase/carboxylesterase
MNADVRRKRMGPLEVHLAGGPDRDGGGDGPLVVLLHGFGAPGTDLVPLWRQMDVAPSVRFAFPEAPLDLAAIAGAPYAGARAWWMIDLAALEARAQGAPSGDRSREVPDGLDDARRQLIETLDVLERELVVPPGQLILGGFSQGAILALDLALRTPRPLASLALMSGTLIARDTWEPLMSQRRGLSVLMSHGRSDPILPFGAAEALRDMLIGAGLSVSWIPFAGGHTITTGVVAGIAGLIQDLVPPR